MDNIEKDNQHTEEIRQDEEMVEEAALDEEEVAETADQESAGDEEKEEAHEHHHHHHHSSHHSRSHHHSRHRHHSSRHRKSSKKRGGKSLKKFWKKNKKILMPIAVFLMIAVILGGIVLAVELISNFSAANSKQNTEGTEGTVILSVSVFHDEISLSNQAAKDIVQTQDLSVPTHVVLENYNIEKTRMDVSQPVQIAFYVVNKPADYTVDRFTVEVAEDDSFADALEYTLDAQQKKIDLYNLKTGTKYYYRVNVHFTNGAFSTVGGGFQTAEGPRILSIGGIRNVRDIGTWKTADGKTVKQGLLFRGTELDGTNDVFKLTEEGRNVLLNTLKVKTDMDLRWPKEIPEGVDPLGDSVEHICYGTPQYTDIFLTGNETVRKIFADLADTENYPVYMHCTYGRDRTGTVCALLLALLGVSEDDLYREYRLTALYSKNLDSSFGGFLSQLKQFKGNTLQEKTQNYLLSVGVTEEEIASVRTIFLG